MKQEYVLMLTTGLLILTYVLDAVVNPLPLNLVTPYHFFTPEIMFSYAFTTTSIILKTIALVLASLWILDLTGFNKVIKGSSLLVVSGLIQLYALQDVVSKAHVLSLEWSLALTLTGMVLLIPAAFLLIFGFLGKAHKKIEEDPYDKFTKEEDL